MLIDQHQKPCEALQEYVQRFPDILLKLNGLLHQAKDFACIMHFIRNVHNHKLHYVFGKNLTSVQNGNHVSTEK